MVGLDKGMLITDCFLFIKAAALLEIVSLVGWSFIPLEAKMI